MATMTPALIGARTESMRHLLPADRAAAIDVAANIIGFDRFLDRQRRLHAEAARPTAPKGVA